MRVIPEKIIVLIPIIILVTIFNGTYISKQEFRELFQETRAGLTFI